MSKPTSDWKQHRDRRRQVAADLSTFDRESRTVRAVIATNQWINGPWGPEKLVMTAGAVDMSRVEAGLPWHDDHGPHLPGGTGVRVGIGEDVGILGGEMTATLRASRSDDGERVLNDIEDRIITHTSLGYRVLDARPTDDGLLVTHWMPMEVSTPSVVADIGAAIQRRETMPDEQTPTAEEIEQRVRGEIMALHRDIHQAYAPFPSAYSIRDRALSEGWDITRANTELLKHLGAQQRPTPQGPDTQAGETDMEKYRRGATEALVCRAMLIKDKDEQRQIQRTNPFFGMSLRELARDYVRRLGGHVPGDPMVLVGQAFTRASISHTTSDFANVLVDAANKAALLGWEEAPETFEPWTRAGSLSDFRVHHNVRLSTFSDIEERNENGEFTYGTFSDFKETNQLKNRGRLFSITREAIINDDLSVFTEAPRGMARAARRKVGDLVYDVILVNPNMSDGNALFSVAHSNFVTGAAAKWVLAIPQPGDTIQVGYLNGIQDPRLEREEGFTVDGVVLKVAHDCGVAPMDWRGLYLNQSAAPDVSALNTAYTAMATQTDEAGNTLNIGPAYIIAGHGLRGTIDALLQSMLNPAEGTTTSFREANIWQNRLTPIYDARLD